LGEARRLDDAFDLVEALESGRAPGRHVELTDVHLNTLVNACAHAGQSLIDTCLIASWTGIYKFEEIIHFS